MNGWQCPVCGRVHAPWVPSCNADHSTVAASANVPTTFTIFGRPVDRTLMKATESRVPDVRRALNDVTTAFMDLVKALETADRLA